MDFSIYERFADYREGKTTDEREDELSNASLQQLFAEIMTRVEQNGEAFERVLANLATEHPPLCPHALEFFEDVRDRCERLARTHRGRFCAKIDQFTYRAFVSLYVPFLSVSSLDLLEFAQRTEGVAMTVCPETQEILLLFSVPFFASVASPLERAFEILSL